MKVTVQFFSYFRDLTGCSRVELEVAPGTHLGGLVRQLHERFPKLKEMERSTLVAVGLEYQGPDFLLREEDEVALFPPVQGG